MFTINSDGSSRQKSGSGRVLIFSSLFPKKYDYFVKTISPYTILLFISEKSYKNMGIIVKVKPVEFLASLQFFGFGSGLQFFLGQIRVSKKASG